MRKKFIIKSTIAIIMILCTIFFVSYSLVTITNNKHNSEKALLQKEINNQKVLDNSVRISLYSGNILEKQAFLSTIKKDYNLQNNISKEDLNNAMETLGYSLKQSTSDDIVYTRDIKKIAIPNKYYIGEFDGFLAIYKCNEEGKLIIEDDTKDIYRDYIKFADLPNSDQELISNFQLVYDTKEQAELEITDIIS